MKMRFDVEWKGFEKGEVVDEGDFGEKMASYLAKGGVARRTGSKLRFNAKWKKFAEGEVVNTNEFAQKTAAYLIERGIAQKAGFAAKKGKETAEKKPKAEYAVKQAAKPEPAKPPVPDKMAKPGSKE